jgi:cytochrome P450
MTSLEYDPFSLALEDDPYPTYRRLRDEAPLYHSDKWEFWALSRFEDVRSAARDWRTFSSAEGMDLDTPRWAGAGAITDLDPPRHDQLRYIVRNAFQTTALNALAPKIQRDTDELVDKFIERGSADFAQELAWELPYLVFFDFMGLPHEPMLRKWSNDFREREDGKRPTQVALDAMENVRQYLADALTDRRSTPRDDLLTEIVNGSIDGEPLAKPVIETHSEIVGLCFLLFIAGTDTTTALIANAFQLLAQHPDQRAELTAHPEKIPGAVEEILRYDTPLQLAARNTTVPVTLHGGTIPSGGRVVLVFGSANRDDREFDESDRFDISRTIKRTVAFGEGIHFCLGAPLARLEGRIALETTLARIPDYEISGDIERFRSTLNMRMLWRLPVTFTPRKARVLVS